MSPNTPFWGQVKFAFYGLAGLILAPFVAAVVLLAMATESIWRPIYNHYNRKK